MHRWPGVSFLAALALGEVACDYAGRATDTAGPIRGSTRLAELPIKNRTFLSFGCDTARRRGSRRRRRPRRTKACALFPFGNFLSSRPFFRSPRSSRQFSTIHATSFHPGLAAPRIPLSIQWVVILSLRLARSVLRCFHCTCATFVRLTAHIAHLHSPGANDLPEALYRAQTIHTFPIFRIPFPDT